MSCYDSYFNVGRFDESSFDTLCPAVAVAVENIPTEQTITHSETYSSTVTSSDTYDSSITTSE